MPLPALTAARASSASYAAAAALSLVLLAACGESQDQGGFHGMPPAQVTTMIVSARTIPVAYEYVGQTTGSKEVEVRARVTGILEQKLFREGAEVKRGQRLFVIDPKPLQAQAAAAQAELARAEAQKTQADREAARLRPLAERKAIGQKEADDAASNAELAAANVRSAEAKLREVELNLGYTTVVAPITGLSSRAPKSEGSLVTANETLLTTISQVHPIWVPFAIPESEQLALQKQVAAGRLTLPKDTAFVVTIRLADGTVFPREGRINFADTRVNPATGSVEYRAEIPNADGALKPGQFVRVRLAGAARNEAIAVPQVAVLDGAQGKFVYVVDRDKDGKDVAAIRPITLGEWVDATNAKVGNLWVVESGLKPGERVIVDGVARVRPGAPVVADAPPQGPASPLGGGAPAKDKSAPAAPKS
jgi:membrane fusion protein (multidrug efflux system)